MKNKTITIYELLGLIKDGKAPKKVKYNETIYVIDDTEYFYVESKSRIALLKYIFEIFNDYDALNEQVEILDETYGEFEDIDLIDSTGCTISSADVKEMATINQLIRNQKKIIEKLKEDD